MSTTRRSNRFNPLVLLSGICLLCLSCQTTETRSKDDSAPVDRETTGEEQIDKNPVTVGGETDTGRSKKDGEAPSYDISESTSAADGDLWVPEEGDFVLRDRQTGSLWNLRGQAFAGPLKGARLDKHPAFNAFWFAWSVFYDGSELWNRDAPNQTAPVKSDKSDCYVPCDEIQPNLPKDRIPAFSHDDQGPLPESEMVEAGSDGAKYLEDSDFVFGVTIDGQARAYAHNVLWHHEIYNDEIDGQNFAVTFCPLTGSGIVFGGNFAEKTLDYGVSGKLYNSNLIMFDRQTETEWSQMLGIGVNGPNQGEELTRLPVVETTWGRWKEMYPDTLVTPNTNANRNYQRYPYGDYRSNHANTFGPTTPQPDDKYKNKIRILGLVGDRSSKGYPFPELEKVGDRVVVNDTFEETPITIAYEKQHRMAIPFIAKHDGQRLQFEGTTSPGTQ